MRWIGRLLFVVVVVVVVGVLSSSPSSSSSWMVQVSSLHPSVLHVPQHRLPAASYHHHLYLSSRAANHLPDHHLFYYYRLDCPVRAVYDHSRLRDLDSLVPDAWYLEVTLLRLVVAFLSI